MALLILVHNTDVDGQAGRALGMVAKHPTAGWYYEQWANAPITGRFDYPAYEPALRDLVSILGDDLT